MQDILYEVMRDYTTEVFYSYDVNDSCLHFHHQLEVFYVEDGAYNVTLNDETRRVEKGELVIVDCFNNHQYLAIGKAKSRCIVIPVHYLKRYSSILNNNSLKEQFFTGEKAQELYKLMLNVIDNLDSNELILEGNILIFIGNLVEGNLVADANKTNYDLVKKILLYIENNFQNPISLDTISQHFGYSKYYFSHLFNKCFKCNLNDYLSLVRCRHSINYVLDEHKSVSDAAYASGFVSMRTFYRTFKRYFNVTPKEYFKINHGENVKE